MLVACGGTGGHLFPGLALVSALAARGIGAVLAVSPKAVDREARRANAGFEFMEMPVIAWPGLFSARLPAFLARFLATWRLVRRAFKRHHFKAVVGMGGFTSLLPVVIGRRCGVPTFLHDSNAVPGKANRMTARHADTVFLGMDAAAAHFGNARTESVGTPVRPELQSLPDPRAARESFGLDPDRATLLVIGGSQGAAALNRTAIDFAARDGATWQVLLLAGQSGHAEATARAAGHPRLRVLEFCHDMAAAYAASDVVLARAGASTLAELAIIARPALLVPYPYAADDHQTANARAASESGAAILIRELDLTTERLDQTLVSLAPGGTAHAAMAAAMSALARPDAADTMAARIAAAIA